MYINCLNHTLLESLPLTLDREPLEQYEFEHIEYLIIGLILFFGGILQMAANYINHRRINNKTKTSMCSEQCSSVQKVVRNYSTSLKKTNSFVYDFTE